MSNSVQNQLQSHINHVLSYTKPINQYGLKIKTFHILMCLGFSLLIPLFIFLIFSPFLVYGLLSKTLGFGVMLTGLGVFAYLTLSVLFLTWLTKADSVLKKLWLSVFKKLSINTGDELVVYLSRPISCKAFNRIQYLVADHPQIKDKIMEIMHKNNGEFIGRDYISIHADRFYECSKTLASINKLNSKINNIMCIQNKLDSTN